MSDKVKLRYSSWANISFRGEIDTNMTWEEWNDLPDSERDEIITERLYELVDIGVVEP